MIITRFTKPEIDYLIENCAFTKDERLLFELRAQENTLEDCAEKMHLSLSTVKRISRRVNNKIIKICKYFGDTF